MKTESIPPDREMLTPKEAASVLRVGQKTLRKWDRSLEPFYFNSRVKRYPAAKLRRFFDLGDEPSAAPTN